MSARGVSLQGVSVQVDVCPGGVCPGECLPGGSTQAVVCPGGVSAKRGVYPGGSAQESVNLPRGQTDPCENITFPQLLLRTLCYVMM